MSGEKPTEGIRFYEYLRVTRTGAEEAKEPVAI